MLTIDLVIRPIAFRPVLRRDPCSYCLRSSSGTVDHIQPRRRRSRRHRHGGGSNTIDNLAGAYEACNRRKADRPLLEFLVTCGGLPLSSTT